MKATIIRGPLPKYLKPTESGVVAAAGVVASEEGTNQQRTSILTFTDLLVTLTDEAGVGQGGGVKIATMPEVAGIITGAFFDGTLLLLAPFIDAASVEIAIGTAVGVGGAAFAGTEKDVLDIAAAVSVAKLRTANKGAAPGLYFDGRAAPVNLYLNAQVADNALHATTAANKFNGRVVLQWQPLTEPEA